MSSNARSLREVPRHELIAAALDLGIERPDRLSLEELQQKLGEVATGGDAHSRGWFSVAKHLVASVVEQGLNLPEAARVIRATVRPPPKQRPPLPTVTLAQIYLAQRCDDRARRVLEQVLSREPHNYKARELLERLDAGAVSAGASKRSLPGAAIGERPGAAQATPANGSARPTRESAGATPSSAGPTPSAGATPSAGPTPSRAGAIARSSAPPSSEIPAPGVARLAHGGARDALLLLRSADGRQLHVYWELSEQTAGRDAQQSVRVQLALVTPSWDGATEQEWSQPIAAQHGMQRLEVGASTVVRGALVQVQQGAPARVLAVASNRRLPESAAELELSSEAGEARSPSPTRVAAAPANRFGTQPLVQEFRPRQRWVDEDVVDRALALLTASSPAGVAPGRVSA